jgi:hypothetical protein
MAKLFDNTKKDNEWDWAEYRAPSSKPLVYNRDGHEFVSDFKDSLQQFNVLNDFNTKMAN